MAETDQQLERNRALIEEFRANKGKVSGRSAGAPVLLLHTVGAKSGKHYTNPLVYLQDGDRLLVFASHGGAPTSPGWYHNLMARGEATVEVGDETFAVTATEIKGEERDRLYAEQARRFPNFGDYQEHTSRTIPVVALQRKRG